MKFTANQLKKEEIFKYLEGIYSGEKNNNLNIDEFSPIHKMSELYFFNTSSLL